MTLIFDADKKRFNLHCGFLERDVAQRAGMFWDADARVWYTSYIKVAARLREYADTSTLKEINRHELTISPWTGRIPSPKGTKAKPFQVGAARFALSRNRSYIAADPGLGKTIIAILIANASGEFCLYVCPPFMVLTVQAEIAKWALYPERIAVLGDSALSAKGQAAFITEWVARFRKYGGGDLCLFIDEAHRYKGMNTVRTYTLFDHVAALFDRVVYLSGTPMPNRPIELYPVLSFAAPEAIDYATHHEYGVKYCAAFEGREGWNYLGCSNFPELVKRTKIFMLRIKKADVLPELPPKVEELVFVGDDLPPQLAAMDRAMLKKYSPEDLTKKSFATKSGADPHLATYRRKLGLLKAGDAAHFIDYVLKDSEESILVFAIHSEVIERLEFALSRFNPLVIVGKTPSGKRKAIVDEFQNNPARRLVIGNLQAMGVGHTMTKATRVIRVEAAWSPGENDQAADRAHRIGQTQSVLVQDLVYKNSLDRRVLESNLNKRQNINQL